MSLSLWSQWNYVVRLVSRFVFVFLISLPDSTKALWAIGFFLSLLQKAGEGCPFLNGRAGDGPLSPGLYSLGNEMLQMCAAWEKRGVLIRESSQDGGC